MYLGPACRSCYLQNMLRSGSDKQQCAPSLTVEFLYVKTLAGHSRQNLCFYKGLHISRWWLNPGLMVRSTQLQLTRSTRNIYNCIDWIEPFLVFLMFLLDMTGVWFNWKKILFNVMTFCFVSEPWVCMSQLRMCWIHFSFAFVKTFS